MCSGEQRREGKVNFRNAHLTTDSIMQRASRVFTVVTCNEMFSERASSACISPS